MNHIGMGDGGREREEGGEIRESRLLRKFFQYRVKVIHITGLVHVTASHQY